MVPTDAEIEATQKKSRELATQADALIKAGLDPQRDLGRLKAQADGEIERFVALTKQENVPAGTEVQCLFAAIEVIGDWAEVETAAVEGLAAGSGSAKPGPASAPVRPGPRRGVRA